MSDDEDEFFDLQDTQKITESFQRMFKISDDKSKPECKHENTKIVVNENIKHCLDCGHIQCLHRNKYKDDNGLYICRTCSAEFNSLNFQQEWRWYGTSDNRTSRDPSRCHKSKSTSRGIKSVFTQYNIDVSPRMLDIMEKKYSIIIEKHDQKITRGSGRDSLVAAILFHTFQEFGEFRTSGYIRKLFNNLEQKHMSAGIQKYLYAFPEAGNLHITSEILIPWFMKLVNIDKSHYRRIIDINNYMANTSQLLKRSNPQSVAASIIYFYLCINKEYKESLGIKRKTFAEKINLSDITITKLVQELVKVSNFNTNEVSM